MSTQLAAGFVYTVEVVKDGIVTDTETMHNLMPTEGLNHLLAAEFAGGSQVGTWYIGIYEGNYTPLTTDTAATFPALATECTTYAEATRVAFAPGSVAGAAVSNSAARAEFTSNASGVKTIYGAFMTSSGQKGSTSGVIASAVKFASPKTFDSGSILRVTADFSITN